MATQRTIYQQDEYSATRVARAVKDISDKLLNHLNTEESLGLMLAANLPGMSSAEVQATFLPFATDLGFTSEAKGLFLEYENKLRPDYFRPVGDSGILLEVERGKTTTNNMDLLDFWKCHLCEHAHYLFLLVPLALRQNDTMSPRKEFATVNKRLGAFFRPRNYTNVRGLFVFGY